MPVEALRVYETCVIATQLVVALGLYGFGLPRRECLVMRCVMTLAVASVALAVAFGLGFSFYPTLTDLRSLVLAVATFACVLAALVGMACAVWNISPLSALFYASSAYLLQTLAFALVRCERFVATAVVGGLALPTQLDLALIVVTTSVVFVACRRLITCHLDDVVVRVPRSPAMAFAIVLSLVLSMVLDLVLKDLMVGLPLHYVVVLSLVDAAICAFVLVAEYEILYAQHLRESVAVMEHTLAEQRRQFALAEGTVESINRRCHDIRHQVLRALYKTDGPVSRETLAEVAHQIDIYGTMIRTGSEALDVAVAEQALLARGQGVRVSCMAEGSALAFMDDVDVYTLFSEMLRVAVAGGESCAKQGEAGVTLGVRARKGLVAAFVEYDSAPGAAGADLSRIDPVVRRYDGSVEELDQGDARRISVLIPQA